jgi:hypothetical protein
VAVSNASPVPIPDDGQDQREHVPFHEAGLGLISGHLHSSAFKSTKLLIRGELFMEVFRSVRFLVVLRMVTLALTWSPITAYSADDIAEMRQMLKEQQALIQAQQSQLEQQAQQLERMSQRLDELTAGKAETSQVVAIAPQLTPDAKPQRNMSPEFERDTVGDLNSNALKAGDFPGAFKIPGSKDISLAIGGSVKTVAIFDSDAEAMGADFTPAYLGTKRSDTDGAFSIDSTLTKVFLDGRAPARDGQLAPTSSGT